MTFKEIALRMYPYWMMGVLMLVTVSKSKYKDLLRIDTKSVKKWIIFLAVITVYRLILFKIFSNNQQLHNQLSTVTHIPIGATLTVFWEDACHGLPLAILSLALGNDKWWKRALTKIAIAFVMISFGLGHVYQGYIAACLLSFYIPYTFKKGKEIGFGTIMLCHTLYDLSTILLIKSFLG